ncbi:MAG: zinc-binding dehydrogenase [Acidimicrobiia bacterium]
MRAVKNNGAGPVTVVDVDEPDGDGEIIEVRSVSICASDFLYRQWGSEQIAGHEIAGVRSDGTPVAVEAIFGCGTCDLCLQGNYNLCAMCSVDVLGMSVPGGMSQYFRAPSRALIPLPDGLPAENAALVEPASVAWHSIASTGVGPDTRVAVVGAGAIGILTVLAAHAHGATDVALVSRHPHQRELGEELGAVEPSSNYDIVIETAGSHSGLLRAIELSRPRGTVGIVGVYPPEMPWPGQEFFVKEVRAAPSIGYCGGPHGRREFAHVADLLASRPELVDRLITHRFGIDDAPAAFEAASNRSAGTFRVVVHPNG